MTVSHAGPDSLALLLATALAVAAVSVREPRHGALLGVLAGLALLTETHLVVLPVICALALLKRWKAVAGVAGVAAAIAGWWYVIHWTHRAGTPVMGTFQALANIDWLRAADFAWYTAVWAGNASFLSLRSWTYRIVLVLLLIALFGLSRSSQRLTRPIWILAGFHLAVALTLAGQGLENVRTGGAAITPGWYLDCLAAASACLAVYGFRSIAPSAVAIPAVVFAALDLYGLHVVLMPYYAGLITFSSSGRLAAFPLGRWSYLVFDRLALNKPVWINSTVLSGLWAGYAVGTFALIGLAIWIARAARVDVCRSTE